ncbi:rhomboid family intramembrane serine protease [Chryseobacterium indologenes]|uniref:Rhomboid family intramembrane serine protease n=1 Tax=Chryseobacterium indologenes TaxID=253 RepID=A0A5R9PL13_CHRID|nr:MULTISPECIES: rhomboid family intramembrane serine protease [Chryseobacterium]ATN05572.1 rhomboid family intramembrane serine protease [Chryseobacterium indologenes]AYY85668.1 rhomboid family intramembrane serine protease [Chryseobacterium indologenes]AYZ35435.1 rhomboid family intramembrane serine protease [Chryseobacterium indologenes]AZB17159.1 rhomboid family intramembrane serine protease [Chryseobacterium indologenes]MBF6644186.1 rhomboid family intramembrane serine protease [Chryseoba
MNILILCIIATAVISFIAFNNPAITEKYKFSVGDILYRKEYIRLLSSGFLHADIMHLVFNMLTLYFFAPIVMEHFGNLGFLIVYIGSILLGNILSLYIYQKQTWYSAVGASGGVSGILFASIALYPNIGIYIFFIPIAIPGYIFGLVYFGYSVYMMMNPRPHDNIGHAAHLGGAFLGLLYAIINAPALAMNNGLYIGIMSLPLIYLAYEIFVRKRIG